MNEQQQRKIIARLHRLEGQVRALERQLVSEDHILVIGQFEAAIAAAKASLFLYIESVLQDEKITIAERRHIVERLVKKLS